MTLNDIPSFWENNPGQYGDMLTVKTSGKGFYNITDQISEWLDGINVRQGLLTVFLCHTSASLIIQENADPDVMHDLGDALERLAPRDADYRHNSEGVDDMPAHIKTMLTATSLNIPVQNSRMVLGTWQGIYLAEHRDRPHVRRLALHYAGTRNE